MKIQRERWIVTRNNRTEIFCGLARDYEFKKIENIGDTAIKTYRSEKQAISAFQRSWNSDEEIEVLCAMETLETN